MENAITPFRIANAILQDKLFQGINILVEGYTDNKLYKKLTCNKKSKIKITFGKEKMRDVYEILNERGFSRVIGIRDADFIRIKENDKYDPNYGKNIFLTDHHDSEGMIINSPAFDDFLLEIAKEGNTKTLIEKIGCLRKHIYLLSHPLACLRFANKTHNLGLAFKPERPEGKTLKFKKFICEKNLEYLGHDKLINTVVEYSTNRGSDIAQRDIISKKLLRTIKCNYPIKELTNGHDLAEILYIICKKGLKINNNLKSASSVEGMLRLAYSREYFVFTELYQTLLKWQKDHEFTIFPPIKGVV